MYIICTIHYIGYNVRVHYIGRFYIVIQIHILYNNTFTPLALRNGLLPVIS